jgi:hypothetical protein
MYRLNFNKLSEAQRFWAAASRSFSMREHDVCFIVLRGEDRR